ncbi:hypothetical protein [Ochrobactrum chromiisoli]|uniref:Uncharacterized protein n=1 Tax=Ochrobactrum chromiisoli TaxID=2993941 RepID=A0ABT3QMX7_9HYPH|nr:hypothetical protein [Ochrobactrum chromiisoli]MCX2696941.1 hypothetical protein [Ochrobactrum chromiisoli]
MPSITFDQLIPIYKNSELQADGRWRLRIADASMLATLNLILTDQKALNDSQIHIDSSQTDLAIGAFVEADVWAPRTGLGVRAESLTEIINTPDYRLREPSRWYLLEERFAYNDGRVPDSVSKYRLTLRACSKKG